MQYIAQERGRVAHGRGVDWQPLSWASDGSPLGYATERRALEAVYALVLWDTSGARERPSRRDAVVALALRRRVVVRTADGRTVVAIPPRAVAAYALTEWDKQCADTRW